MTIDNEQLTIMVSLRDDFNKLVYLISRPCHCEPVRTTSVVTERNALECNPPVF